MKLEFTLLLAEILLFSAIPTHNGQTQNADTVPVIEKVVAVPIVEPIIPEATKRKEEKLKKEDRVSDSLLNRIDGAAEIVDKAAEEVKTTSRILDNTARSLDRTILALMPRKRVEAKLKILTPVSYQQPVTFTVPASKPVDLPQICPETPSKKKLLDKIINWIK